MNFVKSSLEESDESNSLQVACRAPAASIATLFKDNDWVVHQWLSSHWKGRGPDSCLVRDAKYLSSACVGLKACRATPLPSMLEGQGSWVQMLAAVAAALSNKTRRQASENPVFPSNSGCQGLFPSDNQQLPLQTCPGTCFLVYFRFRQADNNDLLSQQTQKCEEAPSYLIQIQLCCIWGSDRHQTQTEKL